MAKVIKMSDEYIEELKKDFEQSLKTVKLSDGKLSFTRSFGAIKRTAVVYYTRTAWAKQQALINECNKEVGWHGVARRGDDPEKDEYVISDILVYPQEVTGSTVTTDQVAYQTWLMNHDDEVFNNIRYQGHSHVNMTTSPSGVDTSLYDRILAQLEDDMFYIFMIWNKRGEKTIKIYDLEKNVLFETADVTVTVIETPDDADLLAKELTEEERKALSNFLISYREKKKTAAFITSSKEMVKDKVYQPQTPPANSCEKYGGWSDGRYGSYYNGYSGSSTASVAQTPHQPDAKKAEDDKQKTAGKFDKNEKRKGRRSKHNTCVIKGFRASAYDDDDDDDFDNMYDWPGKR